MINPDYYTEHLFKSQAIKVYLYWMENCGPDFIIEEDEMSNFVLEFINNNLSHIQEDIDSFYKNGQGIYSKFWDDQLSIAVSELICLLDSDKPV